MFETGFPKGWSTIRKLIFLYQAVVATAAKTLTVTGVSPLSLLNAISHAIISLTQYGLCIQNGTPTPDAPVDIMCNNGALKIVDDELPAAYKRVLGFSCDNNAMWKITGFQLKGSDTVRISFSANAACNVWGCYQGTSATDNYDLYVSTASGAKYFRYGSGTYLSYWSPDDLGERFDVVYTPNGSQGMPQDSTWSPLTFTSANDLLIGSTTLTSTSAKLKGNIYGNFVVDGRLHLIPCERVSDGVLGYYDTYGATFYEPYEGFDGAVSLGYDGSHYSITADGTHEVLTVSSPVALSTTSIKGNIDTDLKFKKNVSGDCTVTPVTVGKTYRLRWTNTDSATVATVFRCGFCNTDTPTSAGVATSQAVRTTIQTVGTTPIVLTADKPYLIVQCNQYYTVPNITGGYLVCEEVNETVTDIPMLLGVGDYKDEVELINGIKTGKVGVKVFDGTEDWTAYTSSTLVIHNATSAWGAVAGVGGYCTHLTVLQAGETTFAGSCRFATAFNVYDYKTAFGVADVAGFKAKLAALYAAGTPVIVLYPLATETTEQTTPHALHTSAGTNVVDVSAAVEGVTLAVEYKGRAS